MLSRAALNVKALEAFAFVHHTGLPAGGDLCPLFSY